MHKSAHSSAVICDSVVMMCAHRCEWAVLDCNGEIRLVPINKFDLDKKRGNTNKQFKSIENEKLRMHKI